MQKVSQVHLRETKLACLDDGEADAKIAEHLRWCARCRDVAADYRWLQGEIAATLATAADAVVAPRPKWWVVQERISAGQRRQVAGWRLSAVASVILAICSMLVSSPVLSTAANMAQTARTLPPEAAIAPPPVPVAISDAYSDLISTSTSISMATLTPAISREGAREGERATLSPSPTPTPALALPPTPPGPETR